jgi:transcriptional regulator with XRE-family HTH domain
VSDGIARQVGARLREVRRAKGFSLLEAGQRSDWSPAAIGSWERAYRTISVPTLNNLAEFYDVPLTVLLVGHPSHRAVVDEQRLVLDLQALDDLTGPDVIGWPRGVELLQRFVRWIVIERGDYNGRVLTLRRDDLPGIAALIGADTPEAALKQLETWGVLT